MPTYEYKCTQCDHRMEAFQSMVDEPLSLCPACGKDKLQRLISAGGGIVFKGSGFYQTDYKSPPRPEKDSGGSESGAEKKVSPPAGSGCCGGGCGCD